ncbi:FUSC family protein [Achromobacter marplatensis]|uniref:FUSC family protein n=1 Tax=Achromobacter marplatensis TaxID=470868 RepID=UPI0039F6BEE2
MLIAYGLMTWQRIPEVAWGAFSALYVVRASVEGTISEAVARIAGAMLGVALGVGLVLLAQYADFPALWSIAVGVTTAAYLSMRHPTLSYSLVTVTILTVSPGDNLLVGAYQKAVAIIIGSVAGILSAVCLLPLSARRSMRVNTAISIEIYGELLVEWASELNEGKELSASIDRPAMQRARWRASDMASQSRAFPMRNASWDVAAYRLHDRVDGLWRTVPLLERASGLALTENVRHRIGPTLYRVAVAARQQLADLAVALRNEHAEPMPCRTAEPLSRFNNVLDRTSRAGAYDGTEREAVELIRWVWNEVTRELDRLCACMSEDPEEEDSARRRQGRREKGRPNA